MKGNFMRKSTPLYPFGFILLLTILACSTATPVAVPTTGSIDVNTAIAQTAAVALTQTAAARPFVSSTFTPQVTLTPTFTATQTFTIAPIVITDTAQAAMITVSVATNCRNGPGKVYDYEGALLVGETTQVLARDSSGEYWYARNPDSSGADYCWLWGKYATLTGNTSVLPIYTPPPTPTATFTPLPTFTGTGPGSFFVVYYGLDNCTNEWWVDLKITNNGKVTYRSLDLEIKDTKTGASFKDLADEFTDHDGCNKTIIKDVLGPEDTHILSGPRFNYNPTGHLLKLTLILCPQTDQKGICAKQNFEIDL
jgi:hypothetical protein